MKTFVNSLVATVFCLFGLATDYAGMDWNYRLSNRTVRIAIQVSSPEAVFPKTNFIIQYFKDKQKLGFEIQTIGPLRYGRGLHFKDFPSKCPAATRIEISAKEAPPYNANVFQSYERNNQDRDIVEQTTEEKTQPKRTPEELELAKIEKSQQIPPACQWLGGPGSSPQNTKKCFDELYHGDPLPKQVTQPDCNAPLSPEDLVSEADVIVRAKAESLSSQANSSQVQFSVAEIVKGQAPGFPILFGGSLEENNLAPQNEPTPRLIATNAKFSCFAEAYFRNQEYLLFLKTGAANQLQLYWSPQSAVNEQITGPQDPWLIWVKQVLKNDNRKH